MKWSAPVAVMLIVGLGIVGCGKDSGQSSAKKSDYQPETGGDGSETAVVTPSSDEEKSPASDGKSTLALDAAPETVIETYVTALNELDINWL